VFGGSLPGTTPEQLPVACLGGLDEPTGEQFGRPADYLPLQRLATSPHSTITDYPPPLHDRWGEQYSGLVTYTHFLVPTYHRGAFGTG